MSDIVEKIRDAGVIGAGGAGFPTHVKIASARPEYVIANGAECEPLLRVDRQVMEFHADDVVEGLRLVMNHTGATRGVIALKEHYKSAIAALEGIAAKKGVTLHLMKSFYPAGDEQQLVHDITGRVVPTGGIPLDTGAVVLNVSTLTNVAAAAGDIPVTEKYVTVTGAVRRPATFRAPVGISMKRLVEEAGGVDGDCAFIIGGPCMGRVETDIDIPVGKATGGIIAIPAVHPLRIIKNDRMNLQLIKAACCQCSICTQMCPRNSLGLRVEPHKAMRSLAQGMDLMDGANGVFSCCECGICTYYACNFGLKPSLVMGRTKAAMQKTGIKPVKEVSSQEDRAMESKRIPTRRLIHRLGLSEYDVDAPLDERPVETDAVRIPLKMHAGAPSMPVVTAGQPVRKGELIADIPKSSLGARIHASIGGRVTDVTEKYIEIKV
ncbi:MAG: SLBB domain-containing protein [Synergistaceae bacterium]|jgi:Na+-translocating ferredoxin:NAD+ oxidoreductase RnfC subunit|nr:SLBB domain-containing protein [Synergistaceae bacterium]